MNKIAKRSFLCLLTLSMLLSSLALAGCNFGKKEENIEVVGLCTYNHCDDFFSARRLGIKSGRILSGIILHG